MPLPTPAPRRPIHVRRVECHGYLREDGLWDVEGRMVDTKANAFTGAYRRNIAAGEAIHDMAIRLTLNDSMEVVAVDAAMDAFPASMCGNITPAYQVLVGLKIAHGWTNAVKELLGGTRGCVHLVELLGPVATTAFQTIMTYRAKMDEVPEPPAHLLNTCHTWAADSPAVKERWPDFKV